MICYAHQQQLNLLFLSLNIDGLVQERRKSSALAMELHLSCINPLIFDENKHNISLAEPLGQYHIG